MLERNKKLVTIEVVHDSYMSQSGIEDIKVTPVSSSSDSVNVIKELMQCDSSILTELLKSSEFVQALSDQGFVNKEKLKDLDSKIQLEKEFYLKYGFSTTKVDLTNEASLKSVARSLTYPGSALLQTVSPKSLQKLSNEAYKIYTKEKRRRKKRRRLKLGPGAWPGK